MAVGYARGQKVLAKERQQEVGLAAAPNTRDDFDEAVVHAADGTVRTVGAEETVKRQAVPVVL